MKITENQKEIILDDGTVVKAAPLTKKSSKRPCQYCWFGRESELFCSDIPCHERERKDKTSVIFTIREMPKIEK